MMRPAVLAVVLTLGSAPMSPGLASGEPFLDVYGGLTQTQSARVTAQSCIALVLCVAESGTARTIDFEHSMTFGARRGYWLKDLPWVGVAVDLSFFTAEQSDVRFVVVPLSALLMLRLSFLPTEDLPGGHLQPYLGFGPSVYYEHASVDFRPEMTKKTTWDRIDITLDARVGLAWQFNRRLALFGEYRFMPPRNDGTKNETLKTHHFLRGVSVRF